MTSRAGVLTAACLARIETARRSIWAHLLFRAHSRVVDWQGREDGGRGGGVKVAAGGGDFCGHADVVGVEARQGCRGVNDR